MDLYKTTATLVLAAALAASGAAMVMAGSKKAKTSVTVKSDYGNGTLTAAIRKAQFGYQVLLPGGLWYYCELTCKYTLRRESLDFWESQSDDRNGDFD